jgi:hypothetical protein
MAAKRDATRACRHRNLERNGPASARCDYDEGAVLPHPFTAESAVGSWLASFDAPRGIPASVTCSLTAVPGTAEVATCEEQHPLPSLGAKDG